jgi:MYXO-CTERM domain-containing protein
LASGWAANADFKSLAMRLEAGIAMVGGGDDLDPGGTYPKRCASGEFNNIPEALKKLAVSTNHPELANIPLVGLGHSHGGDFWNWFNACHPERMAMVFVHASGGVNYSAASLKVPVFYTLGTGDLIERGSKKPRAGMFVNRAKGAPMTMVIGEGGHDTQFGAAEYQIVTAIIEAIFKMRVPADADASKGPVLLRDIVEGDSTWVGDLYTKEISTFSTFKGNKALTAFLPNEQLAMMWKTAAGGPALPKEVVLPSDTCSWCGKPNDEPKSVPGAPPADPGAMGTPDAGGGSGEVDAGTPDPTPPATGGTGGGAAATGGTAGSSSGGGASGASSGGAGPSTSSGGATTPPSSGSGGSSSAPPSSGGDTGPTGSSGCAVGLGGQTNVPVTVLGLLGLCALLVRRRRR